MKELVTLYQQLKQEWRKKNRNLEMCGKTLKKLKITLAMTSFLPTSLDNISAQELLIARDIMEIGAQWSIEMKDISGFERYMCQLKNYYFDYQKILPESPYCYQLLGLNLLYILSQNRVADFHSELELLPKEIHSNIYIRHPISLEQYLMEGAYNKIFLAKSNVPANSYTFFIDMLLDTVRDEIGNCLEKAYERISLTDAIRLLFLASTDEIYEYCKRRSWIIKNNNLELQTNESRRTDEPIASCRLALTAIEYARQLEMIV